VNKQSLFSNADTFQDNWYMTINSIEYDSAVKTLVLEEIGLSEKTVLTDLPSALDTKLTQCDVVCFMYNVTDPNSFSPMAKLCKTGRLDHVPVLVVGTHMEPLSLDIETVPKQRYPIQPAEFCRQRHWLSPLLLSLAVRKEDDMYYQLIDLAMNPYDIYLHAIKCYIMCFI
jgi:mitochondrial Rho GTPase 1